MLTDHFSQSGSNPPTPPGLDPLWLGIFEKKNLFFLKWSVMLIYELWTFLSDHTLFMRSILVSWSILVLLPQISVLSDPGNDHPHCPTLQMLLTSEKCVCVGGGGHQHSNNAWCLVTRTKFVNWHDPPTQVAGQWQSGARSTSPLTWG